MGTPDEPTPKVRPLGEETPPPTSGPRTVIGVVVVIAIAGAIFLTAGPTPSPTEGVALPPLPTTSSTSTTSLPQPVREPDEPSAPITKIDLALSARMAELLDDANAVWEVLPEAEGEFVAIIGDPAAMDMVRVTRTSSLIQLSQPIVFWQSLAFDASGQHLAYVGDSPISDLPALHVESDTSVPVRDDVASFAWHSTIPGRIGWQELTSELLCWADLGGPHEPDAPTCVPGPEFGTRIVGFDDDGFLGIDDIGQTVSRYGFDGHVIGTISGENAWPRPNGDILIAERDRVNDLTIFTNVDRNLANPNQLTWAPQIRTDAEVLIAISPSVAYQEIAFVTASGEHQQLQVFNIYGELTHTIPLLGRIWDLAWDSTGRYLLAPGFVDSEHVLRIYDAVNPGIFATSFSGWIQQALLVTPAYCEDASPIVASLSRRMPPDLTIKNAQLVRSRDSYLLSFSFVSGEVIGGVHDGEIATWALFAFGEDEERSPTNVMALNEPAKAFNIDNLNTDGNVDWMHIDGMIGSQICVSGSPPVAPVP